MSEQQTVNVLSDTVPRQPILDEYTRLLELKKQKSRDYDKALIQGPKNGKYLVDSGIVEEGNLTSNYREDILIIYHNLALLKRLL